MPWLTPDEIPSALLCRALFIPDSSEIIADVSGALLALTQVYNWQKFGSIEPEDMAAAMQAMYLEWLANVCSSCTLPGGSPVLRLGLTGHFEELGMVDWVEPSGDYTVPPVPARTEPTEDERKCAAAANAANVLQILYESLSDSFNSGLSAAEAIAALIAAIVGAIGAVFGLLVAPLIIIGALIFGVIYATVEFITMDLWDENFTKALTCYLLQCANDDGDVVTFDFTCVLERLAEHVDVFDLTTEQIRLFGQLYTILQFLGADSLDAAGATTGVEFPDCSECAGAWCWVWDKAALDAGGDWTHEEDESYGQVYTMSPAGSFSFYFAELTYTWNDVDGGDGSGSVVRVDGSNIVEQIPLLGGDGVITYDAGSIAPTDLLIGGNTVSPSGGGVYDVVSFKLKGVGTLPAFAHGELCDV